MVAINNYSVHGIKTKASEHYMHFQGYYLKGLTIVCPFRVVEKLEFLYNIG